jgi:hypothetical protein
MKERPIIFNAEMVRAIMEDRKTQTRRVVKPQPPPHHWEDHPYHYISLKLLDTDSGYSMRFQHILGGIDSDCPFWVTCPYGKPGDRLWVRETWSAIMNGGWTIADARRRMFDEKIVYRADGNGYEDGDGWWPSIHMPREFSRLTLTVTDVRVQRVQDVTEEDAQAEGARPAFSYPGWEGVSAVPHYRWGFHELWNSIHGPDAWDANPWVVALTFTVRKGNIDEVEA